MIETLTIRFVESPRRWLIVTGVTLVIALLTVLPQADELLAARAERAELEEHKDKATGTAGMLADFEARVVQTEAELAELRRVEVDDERVADLRSWLVQASREAGCQVRRIELGRPSRRPWLADDSPLATDAAAAKKKEKTPFELQTRPVTLSVTGATPEIRALLKTLDRDPRIKFASSMELRPEGRLRDDLQLDLSLRYFALAPAEKRG